MAIVLASSSRHDSLPPPSLSQRTRYTAHYTPAYEESGEALSRLSPLSFCELEESSLLHCTRFHSHLASWFGRLVHTPESPSRIMSAGRHWEVTVIDPACSNE